MPMVGKKKYSYGPKGMAAARAAAKRTGKPLSMRKKKKK